MRLVELQQLYENEERKSIYQVLGGWPEENEVLGSIDLGEERLKEPLPVRILQPEQLKQLKATGRLPILDAFKGAERWQKKLVSDYRKNPPLGSNDIVIIFGNRIMDGHHRIMAAILEDRPIKAINLSDLSVPP